MTEILLNPSNIQLGKAIIDNHISYMRILGKTPYVKLTETNEYMNIDFGLKCYSAQGITYSNIQPENADQLIQDVTTYYEKRKQPFTWGILSYHQPSDMHDRLISHGFKFDGPYPAMAVKLSEVNDRNRPIKGFSYEVVEDDETCETYWKVWGEGYPMPDGFRDILCKCSMHNGYGDVPNRLYLGYLNGEPVATSQLILSDGVSGVHDVTVLPSARGKGVGTEMSMLPLRDAVNSGYHYGVLCATELGKGVYQRLGFKEYLTWDYYSKLEEYLEPTTQANI